MKNVVVRVLTKSKSLAFKGPQYSSVKVLKVMLLLYFIPREMLHIHLYQLLEAKKRLNGSR